MDPRDTNPDYPSASDLLAEAQNQLSENYDPLTDTFFVVITKNGKVDDGLGSQITIGELGLRPTMSFIWQAMLHFAEMLGDHPYEFVVRNVLSPLIDREKELIKAEAVKEESEVRAVPKQKVPDAPNSEETGLPVPVVLHKHSFDVEN